MTPGQRLQMSIQNKGLVHIMAAHSPISALLAQEAGFDGIWASGFELSALYGVPDMSIVTMSQHLDMVRAMAAATSLPVIADIDTGFGNAINVSYAIRAYEAAGTAAVVIEDKIFPKVTSLAQHQRQALVSQEEFQGKIAAALHARRSGTFSVIARTEALIAGLSQEEALARARSYEAAGAAMILVHSRKDSPDEIESFVRRWDGQVQLVIVPTAYPQLDESRIRALGRIAMVIYANHAIRASVTAMRQVFARIRRDGGIRDVEADIVPVADIFRLQGMDEADDIERQFVR